MAAAAFVRRLRFGICPPYPQFELGAAGFLSDVDHGCRTAPFHGSDRSKIDRENDPLSIGGVLLPDHPHVKRSVDLQILMDIKA
jgi:hypothetical protein